jgi:transcriptional regulator with XRE-family HTH domain
MGSDLKHFLSHKRAQIAPATVGLNGGRTRRTAGLTREDMAELTGVSFRWYKQYESGAAKGVSRQFAERVAAVFNLSAAERHYLWALLGFVETASSDTLAPATALHRCCMHRIAWPCRSVPQAPHSSCGCLTAPSNGSR